MIALTSALMVYTLVRGDTRVIVVVVYVRGATQWTAAAVVAVHLVISCLLPLLYGA